MQHACRQVKFPAMMINALWHRWHRTLNEMAVKSRELQYHAAVSYETLLAKINQGQIVLGGKLLLLLLIYNLITITFVEHRWVAGRETTPKHISRRWCSVFQCTTQRLGSDQESKLIWTVLKVWTALRPWRWWMCCDSRLQRHAPHELVPNFVWQLQSDTNASITQYYVPVTSNQQ